MKYTIAVCTVKTPDDGQRNYPKYVEFHSKNKFEKIVNLVGFIIQIQRFISDLDDLFVILRGILS